MVKCKYCGKEYKLKGIHNHERVCESNPEFTEEKKDFLRVNAINTNKIIHERGYKNLYTKKQIYTLICKKCGKQYILNISKSDFEKGKYKKFCSRSCANSRVKSEETKNKVRLSLIKKPDKCKICNKEFNKKISHHIYCCCDECNNVYKQIYPRVTEDVRNKLSIAGRKSAQVQSETRRSKNEKYFCELCEKHFTNVDHNNPIFGGWDADVIIHDIKFAILWNGIWHYKKITKSHSVNQVQNRDQIKIHKIEECGYKPYIIKDESSGDDLEYVTGKFNEFMLYVNNIAR